MEARLYDRIYDYVRTIPPGRVSSYGQVAKAVGMPRGARIIGWALRVLPLGQTDVPWQRVVNQKGIISIQNPKAPRTLQKLLLEEEGVMVREQSMGVFQVDPQAWWPSV